MLEAFETLGNNDVPDDGERYALVGWKQWSNLLQIEEFASADFIGPENLPWKGSQAKEWLSFKWIPSSAAPLVSTERLCYMYHRTAIGHAIAAEVATDVTWHGDRAAHFVSNSMSQGSCLIDALGVVEIECVDTWDPS